uniref:G protein-coupled receptor n=1 Tax=Rhabditophanes sp. KR3021 TaxID=114890 RepID=A0AC35U2V8_9BILA
MYPAHDTLMHYSAIVGSTLCTFSFLLMHFVPTKTYDKFSALLKWGRLLDSIVPFLLGIVCQAQAVPTLNATVCNGLCYRLGSPLCSKMALFVSMAIANVIVFIYSITALMRYNVLVREKKFSYLTLFDKIILSFVLFIGPIIILGSTQGCYLLDFDTIPADEFDVQEIKKYLSPDYYLFPIRMGLQANYFTYCIAADLFIVLTVFVIEVAAYFVPIELSLRKAIKEAQTETVQKIRNSINYLRFLNLIPIMFALVPTFIPMTMNYFRIPGVTQIFTDNAYGM